MTERGRFYNIQLFFLIVLCVSASCTRKDNALHLEHSQKEVLKELDNTIKNAGLYIDEKNKSIDSLRTELNSSDEAIRKLYLLSDISALYRQLDSDSAIFYGLRATDHRFDNLPDSVKIKGKLALVNALSTSGIFNEALKVLNDIDPQRLSPYEKIEYWKSARILYAYALAYLDESNVYASAYREKYIESDDSLLALMPRHDNFHRFIFAERLVNQRRWNEAKKELEYLMKENPKESNIYGMSAYQLAEVHKNLGDKKEYIRDLALAAESDVRGAVNEGLALPALAQVLYEHGDLEEAFKYMNYALKEANNANIRMRTVSIANNMAIIDQAYKRELDSSNRIMTVLFIVTSSLLVIASSLSVVLILNFRKAKNREKMMEASSRKLQSYVGNFIGLCANYSSRLEQLAKLVTRKITAGQGEELLKLLGHGRFTEEDNEEFYKLIDKAFIDMFPDFAARLNTLLEPDKQIEFNSETSTLNPELRIYACVRMGVTQSSRIAQILHYSVNTVYAYRNKMRSRAINRETFDEDVEKLGLED